MRVVLIGSGNVGWHLGVRLAAAGYTPVQVVSRTAANAHALAGAIHTEFKTDLASIQTDADVYLLAVPDDAITEVATSLSGRISDHALVAHTSGSVPSAALSAHNHYGVLYPLQTFTKSRSIDWSSIPLLLTGSTDTALARLEQIAGVIGGLPQIISDKQRAILHVAAAIACNFTNHMYRLASDLLQEHELSFDLLKPLILETAEKVQQVDPAAAQTGPAVRGDLKTLERHMAQLSGHPQRAILYALVSRQIQDGREV